MRLLTAILTVVGNSVAAETLSAQDKPYTEDQVISVMGILGPERTLERIQRACIAFNVTKAVEARFRELKATEAFLAGLRGTCKKLPEPPPPIRHQPVREPPKPVEPPPPDTAAIHARERAADSAKSDVGLTLVGAPPSPGLETLNARVTVFRFFEGPNPGPPLGTRQYADTFQVSAARYIYGEIELNYVGPSDVQTFSLACTFERQGSGVPRALTVPGKRETGVGTFLASFGLGWDNPGQWYPGRYVVECLYGDTAVARQAFQVVGVTSESAFDAAKAAEAAGNLPEAVTNYAAAAALAPDSHIIAFALGNARAKLGQTDSAIAGYRQAVKLMPSNLLYHKTLAEYLRDSNRTADADTEFQAWIGVDPANAWLRGQHALVLLALNRPSEAIAEYDEAAKLAPSESFYAFRAAELRKQFPSR